MTNTMLAARGPDLDRRQVLFSLHSVFQKIKLVSTLKIVGFFFYTKYRFLASLEKWTIWYG